MKRPETLSSWDFKDTKSVPDGYDYTSVPQATDDNFNRLLEKYNELVEFVGSMGDHIGFDQ